MEEDFLASLPDVDKFWSRFPQKPDLSGKKVLDLGCGVGAMVFHMAQCGASRVVGLDILEHYIEFNRQRLAREFPRFAGVIDFRCQYLESLAEGDFDIILSKDSFEHILGLEDHLREMEKRLRPDGRIYVAFAPLWRSIRGDHGRTRTRLPWGHVIFPERVILQGLREVYPDRTLNSIADLGLNKVGLRELKAMLRRTGLRFAHLRVNAGGRRGLRVYNLGRLIPGLAEYFTHNVYAIIEKAPK